MRVGGESKEGREEREGKLYNSILTKMCWKIKQHTHTHTPQNQTAEGTKRKFMADTQSVVTENV